MTMTEQVGPTGSVVGGGANIQNIGSIMNSTHAYNNTSL